MKYKAIVTLGLILIAAFAVGVLWATENDAPADQAPKAQLPTDTEEAPAELPGDELILKDVGFCANATPCPTVPCGGPGCDQEIGVCDTVDLGVRCCVDNGQVFECDAGETVHRKICECESECPHLPTSKSNFCQ